MLKKQQSQHHHSGSGTWGATDDGHKAGPGSMSALPDAHTAALLPTPLPLSCSLFLVISLSRLPEHTPKRTEPAAHNRQPGIKQVTALFIKTHCFLEGIAAPHTLPLRSSGTL